MKVIEAVNVNDAVAKAIPYLLEYGSIEDTRNGPCIVAPGPVVTVYEKPMERVLFSPLRDANPFFHLMESLWMLAGRNDLEFVQQFNKRFDGYSDDGRTVHGAYGFRWRNWYNLDQLAILYEELRDKPNTRRAVLNMWSPIGDLIPLVINDNDREVAIGGLEGRDVPCNTHCYFDVRGGRLNMTVCNRSNDIIWGAYGANVVHFSVLQEYMAGWLGVPVGEYRQFSNNFHAYLDVYSEGKLQEIAKEAEVTDYYHKPAGGMNGDAVDAMPMMMTDIEAFNEDLMSFMMAPMKSHNYRNKFFAFVATPMYYAWHDRKKKLNDGMKHIEKVEATDWKQAATMWIGRRERKH